MNSKTLIERIRGGLIVSCQALDDEPLYGTNVMPRMAVAARAGGAVGIRANGSEDIRKIKAEVSLPVIGIVKRTYPDSPVYITPTLQEITEVAEAGADVVALDATAQKRPDGVLLPDLILQIREQFPELLVMADVSTLSEGVQAAQFGVDLVASTMSGYTPYSQGVNHPDFSLISALVQSVDIPVIAEGRIRTPEQAARCIELGCVAVVVGSAITRPQEITRSFVERLQGVRLKRQNRLAP